MSLVCDLGVNGETDAAVLVAETEYGTGSLDFSFWGTAGNGELFCCAFDNSPTVNLIVLDGTSLADWIDASSLYDPGGTYQIGLAINGYDGGDLLIGSDTYMQYDTAIDGGPGADNILGGHSCDAEGGAGADYIYGGSSGDEMYGFGPGQVGADLADEIHGNGGNDFIYGDSGNDILNGDAGSDAIDGNAGADIMCGGAEDDNFDGGDGPDDIWGGGGTDNATGGGGSDQCNVDNHDCESFLSTIPAECN